MGNINKPKTGRYIGQKKGFKTFTAEIENY
jgi:hypothetical protein